MKNLLFLVFLGLGMPLTAQHTLELRSGEKMNGQVVSLSEGRISFLSKGNTRQYSVADVAGIRFEETGTGSPATTGMKGVRYVLEGRTMDKPPRFENLTMKKGIVTVAVMVDKYGNVKKAEPGAEGTTTSDEYLLTLSQKAAEGTKFNNCPKCPLEMNGTITFTY